MKYYYCVSKMIVIDFNEIGSFISEHILKNGINIIKLSFNDDNYIDFLKKSRIGEHFTERDNYIIVLGEDNNLYRLSADGFEKIENPKNTITLEKYIQNTYKFSKIIKIGEDYRQNIISKYEPNKINKTGKGFAGYDKYVFIDKRSDRVIPYRFRKAHRKNQPLIVYFGGAGTIGHDNFKQFFEHFTLGQTLKLIKADCNILVPQFTMQKYINESYCREIYTDAVTNLIAELQSENDIDSNRIYIYGCSFGGGLTWNMLVNHYDITAGAIELMGEYYGYKSVDEIDFEKIAKVPIWMAHSVDDNVVSIESDDKFYQKLKEHNGNVKYTRPDKYAHKLVSVFLRNEKWVEWILNQ